jgi:serine/threonine protein kinase
MADNDSVFEFHLEVADLTEIRRKDSTLDRELPYTQKPIAEDSHLEALRSVDDLIIRLDDLGVPGPLTVDPSPRKHLGEGGQFIVYEGSLLDPSTSCETETETEAVAIKTPKFGVFPDGQLDLTSSTSRRQINDFYLEVVALRNQALLNSRNVVQLLGWTVAQTIHQTPSLVFELALGTMASIFEGPEITWHIKHQLCLDVGNGLDAIHKAGIIHSDLRPQNVLIFRVGSWNTPLVAKLADFGASEAEQGAEGDTVMEVKGLSYDWSAPEISLNARVTMSQMLKADVFSWGLLVLSFSCLKGAAPSCKESDAAASIVRETAGISASYLVLLTTALPLLLHPNPAERPQEVGHLLVDESEACEMW